MWDHSKTTNTGVDSTKVKKEIEVQETNMEVVENSENENETKKQNQKVKINVPYKLKNITLHVE